MINLYDALEARPDDRLTLLALADWYEENAHPGAAACLRWLAEEGKHPYRYYPSNGLRHHHPSWSAGWYWWTNDQEPENWGYPAACKLPYLLWDRLADTFSYDPIVFKEYPTVRGTFEAAIAAWVALPEAKRPSVVGQAFQPDSSGPSGWKA
jgi:hypothetical protein